MNPEPTADQRQQMLALLQEMRKNQIDFLDQSGKRFVELTSGLLGVLFAVTAFGDKFPPPYLVAIPAARWLAVLTLLCFLSAMLMGMRTSQPRDYAFFEYDASAMSQEFSQIIAHKSQTLRWAGILFWIGAVCLALLVVVVIFTA
jgi:hypothetical protein